MPIYTASYFQPDHHHGRLISISCSAPKGIFVHGQHSFLAPPADLHKDWEVWKRSSYVKLPKEEHIAEYKERYKAHILANWQAIAEYLNNYNHWDVETWLCWEKPGEFCHRNLALAVVEKHWPHLFGGADVPMAIASPGLHYWFTNILKS